MKKLLVVESPAKIKTISKFLGSDFTIVSTLGHIKDLPSKEIGVTMGDPIKLDYVVLPEKKKTVSALCKAAKQADEIFLAPDPDREGEIIAFHAQQEIEKVVKKGTPIHRIAFNEITKPAVINAIENPYKVDSQRVAAQQARRVLDRWVGYQVSPILWRRVAKGLSAGRVQSAALRIVCEREEAIRAFKPEEYWSLDALFKSAGAQFGAALTHIKGKKIEVATEQDAKKHELAIKNATFVIDKVEDKKRIKNPYPPFMTSTLQQAAHTRLGMPVKKTMQIAQKLYEGVELDDPSQPVALITYMRTDSLRISDTALKQTRAYIKSNFADTYLPSKSRVFSKSKKSKSTTQDAHEAIRPVDVSITPDKVANFLDKGMARVYEIIWRRFVASQMSAAQYAQRAVTVKGDVYTYKATGSSVIFDGYLRVYQDESKEKKETMLPKELAAKCPAELLKVAPKQHFTQPPARFNEASLVKEMEKEGIGRPSTYGATLNTLQLRQYATLDPKKRFFASELGMKVNELLTKYFPRIMDIKFTAHMEEDLDNIAQGELERDKLLKEFYTSFEQELAVFEKEVKGKEAVLTELDCPECKEKKLAIRFGKNGEFLGCSGFPECTFTSPFERDDEGLLHMVERKKPELLDEPCPKCGTALRKIVGRNGEFIACSAFPKCKYIKQNVANFPCPKCKSEIAERKWRGKVFWGCNNYPKCKFSISGNIDQKPCPKCKTPYRLLRFVEGVEKLICSDKECKE
ncbi:type I DNA topoisomerase [bacterium]|jgi:DNA topoisomerase I|nr:type I DNA topoisomerase [bacterium]